MTEPAKRLKPAPDTIRHLFAHSGNVCAFAGCEHPLIDAHSNFVSQVCHIEAAEPGGPRFNPAMSNEERRHRDNLLLMCLRHHIETDDADRFPVADMRQIKVDHEAKYAAAKIPVPEADFEEAVQAIVASSIVDQTKRTGLRLPQTLSRFGETRSADEQWTLTAEELQGDLSLLHPMLEELRRLPVDTRGVLLVVVERGQQYDADLGLPVHELEHATHTDSDTLRLHIHTLDRYGIARLDEEFRDYESVCGGSPRGLWTDGPFG